MSTLFQATIRFHRMNHKKSGPVFKDLPTLRQSKVTTAKPATGSRDHRPEDENAHSRSLKQLIFLALSFRLPLALIRNVVKILPSFQCMELF